MELTEAKAELKVAKNLNEISRAALRAGDCSGDGGRHKKLRSIGAYPFRNSGLRGTLGTRGGRPEFASSALDPIADKRCIPAHKQEPARQANRNENRF